MRSHSPRWMPLDNAAKIYPAALRSNWSNLFRLSVTLTEPVEIPVLQAALDHTVGRFPSIAARLRRGVFWYYLQQLDRAPQIRTDRCCPVVRMSRQELRQCAFRVLVYDKRIAVEFFHSLTDGTGGMIFLKTLTAEYLTRKYGIVIPAEQGVLDRNAPPREEELEDSFLRWDAPVNAGRKETTAWRIRGTREDSGFHRLTCFQLDARELLDQAHARKVSLTVFLCAVMMKALLELQAEIGRGPERRRPIKVLLPVNLRKVFPSRTLRNFALYTIPSVDPRLGSYTLEELCKRIHHRMGMDINPKQMGKMIAVNVNSERYLAVRILPLFLKNLVMRAVFSAVGEKKSCLTLSNLGQVELPAAMKPYVQRMDFILSVQATAPYNCGVVSYGDTVYVNFIRNIREPYLESRFFRVLRELGIGATVESNEP